MSAAAVAAETAARGGWQVADCCACEGDGHVQLLYICACCADRVCSGCVAGVSNGRDIVPVCPDCVGAACVAPGYEGGCRAAK